MRGSLFEIQLSFYSTLWFLVHAKCLLHKQEQLTLAYIGAVFLVHHQSRLWSLEEWHTKSIKQSWWGRITWGKSRSISSIFDTENISGVGSTNNAQHEHTHSPTWLQVCPLRLCGIPRASGQIRREDWRKYNRRVELWLQSRYATTGVR